MKHFVLINSKLLGWIFFSLFANILWAQPYDRAPILTERVYQIIEWTQADTKSDPQLGGTSTFNKTGQLLTYFTGKDSSDLQSFRYDSKGRLIEHVEYSGERKTLTLHVYKKDVEVREVKFRDRIEKTFLFFKKGKKVEAKTFVKGEELGDVLTLKNRIVYNYDKRDSLIGEMHYAYPMRSKRKPQKRKTLYHYDEQSGKKAVEIHYDFDGNLRLRIQYDYLPDGKISRMDYLYPQDGPSHFVEYQYQKNSLWQITEESDFRKYVRIFKDGRLIRSRNYQDGSLFQIIDYQYVYY